MMRFPNTVHWQLIERTCRTIAQRGWRHEAAIILGVPKADLRSTYDRHDLDGPALDRMHARLKAAIVMHRKAAEDRMLFTYAAVAAVEGAQDERLRHLQRIAEQASLTEANARFTEFANAFFADLMEDA
jgi:hypothetical protein